MSELVDKLTSGRHPVEIMVRPERTLKAFKRCIDRGYVHVKFPNTQGGTELGVRIDPIDPGLGKADFDAGHGQVTLRGSLILDYVPVKCCAVIDLQDMRGEGWLELANAN